MRLLTHRLGFFKIRAITAILRQAGTTDDPIDSLTTRSMCDRTQSSTVDSFSRRVGAGSSMHDTLAEPWTSLRRSADVRVEKLSRVGHRGREWLLQQRRQLLLHVVQSCVDSSHLAEKELHNAVSQRLFAIMR